MKKRKTITEAAIEVLRHSDKTLSVSEIYAKIIENSLYEFHAQNPLSVLRVELRGHAVGIDYPSASSKKYFLYDEVSRTFGLANIQTKYENVKKEVTPLSTLRELHLKYTDEFKQQLVELYRSGKRRCDICREYDIATSLFDKWVKQASNSGSFHEKDNRTPEQEELIRLRKENQQLRMENDILKQAALILGRK